MNGMGGGRARTGSVPIKSRGKGGKESAGKESGKVSEHFRQGESLHNRRRRQTKPAPPHLAGGDKQRDDLERPLRPAANPILRWAGGRCVCVDVF
jgi:hypothetical protein